MKFSLLFTLIFLFVFDSRAQLTIIPIDYDYFLLGTLNDYMGREKYKGIDHRVDEYSQGSKSLVHYIDSVFKISYTDLKVTTHPTNGRLEMHSARLAEKMNDFYIFAPSGRGVYNGETDISNLNLDSLTKTTDFYTANFDTLYTGKIKEHIFSNDTQRYSFIAGAYLRFGGRNDSLYFIDMANSTSKVRIATEQLKALQCTYVEYVIKSNYIPCGHKVYFAPTDELKDYLDQMSLKIGTYTEK